MLLCVDDIHFIPFNGKWLLHAPLHGVAACLNRAGADALRQAIAANTDTGLPEMLLDVWRRLTDKPCPTPAPPSGPFAPVQVGLLPTNDCNMRCIYCAVGAGTADRSTMSPEICDAALRYQAAVVQREGYRCFSVALFGGEPFFARTIVEQCAHRGRELADSLGVPFLFTGDTNAFMSAEYAGWIAEHLSYLLVSLDGPPDIQNTQRPAVGGGPTYGVVARNVEIFQDKGLSFALRCSVSDQIVERVPEIAAHFCERFRPKKINFEPLVVTGRCEENRLLPPHPGDFVRAVVEAGKIARQHGVPIKLSTAQPECIACSNCQVARDHFVVTPDGLAAACYGANHKESPYAPEYVIGAYNTLQDTIVINQERVEHLRSYGVENIPRCTTCFCKWHCAGGCRLHHTAPFCKEPPNALCLMTQRLTVWRILTDMGLYEEADKITLEREEVEEICHAAR